MPEFISSVSYDQQEVLNNILKLYVHDDHFMLDPTYSKGNFYKNGIVKQPLMKYDIAPMYDDVIQADVRDLPLDSRIVTSIIFDPPFIHAAGANSIIGNRFGSYKTQYNLRVLYDDALREFVRVLCAGGILVFKCQDIVESGKQVLSHCFIWEMATGLGFEALDLFILINNNKLVGHNHYRQVHAHKHHSYFLVFKRG